MYNCGHMPGAKRTPSLFVFLLWASLFTLKNATGQATAPMGGQTEVKHPACALLTLEVDPKGSTTWLNGRVLDSNVWLISLLPGYHRLEIQKAGFRPYVREMHAASGERLNIAVTLEREL